MRANLFELYGAIAGAGVSAVMSYLLGSRQGRINSERRRDAELERRLRKVEVRTAILASRSNRKRRNHDIET